MNVTKSFPRNLLPFLLKLKTAAAASSLLFSGKGQVAVLFSLFLFIHAATKKGGGERDSSSVCVKSNGARRNSPLPPFKVKPLLEPFSVAAKKNSTRELELWRLFNLGPLRTHARFPPY